MISKIKSFLDYSTLHLYYLVMLYSISPDQIIREHYSVPAIPHFVISWVPLDSYTLTFTIISWGAVLSFSILIIYPWSRVLRILALLCWVFMYAYGSSFAKSDNEQYAATFSMLALIFLPSSKENAKRIFQTLFVAKFSAVMCYAMAGIWKLRMIPTIWEEGFIMGSLGNAIAMEHLKYGHSMSNVSLFFLERDYLTGPMFLGLILLQAFSPLLIFGRRIQLVFGLLICLFHILSEVIVHISFRDSMYLMMVLFIYDPLIQEYKLWRANRV